MSDRKDQTTAATDSAKMCFVFMPITDSNGYEKGHFKHVYEDIVRPACVRAGFNPVRADEVKQSNLIHLDILKKLLEAPMAVCDLSNRNPNVLFELALRQAFDKPVALIQEVGTPPIFDIAPLRFTEYRKERIYHEVLEDQQSIASAIEETFNSHGTGGNINSIVKLLALNKPAVLPNISSSETTVDLHQIVLAEFSQLREEVRSIRQDIQKDKMPATWTYKPKPSGGRTYEVAPQLKQIAAMVSHLKTLLTSNNDFNRESVRIDIKFCIENLRHITDLIQSTPFSFPDSIHSEIRELSEEIQFLQNYFLEKSHFSAKKKT